MSTHDMVISRVTMRRGVDPRLLASAAQADSYGDHKALWKLFPQGSPQRPFLFRREVAPNGPKFIVVSSRLPIASDALWSVESKPYHPRVRQGQRLAFCLRANPVVSRRDEENRQVRHDLVMDARARFKEQGMPRVEWPALPELVQEQCSRWLVDRASRHGFALPEASLACDGYRQHRLPRKRGRAVHFSSVDYLGHLEVVDPELFLRTLYVGIGHAKAFGCGLLLVKPAM